MHEGVHVDRFLRPIKVLKGIRGGDLRPRRTGRWAQHDVSAEDKEAVEAGDDASCAS